MVAASNGVASFSDLTVGTAATGYAGTVGTGYTVTASGTNLTSATTNPFAVIPGAATKFVVTTEPASSVAAGSPFGFIISAEDQFGDLATSFNGTESITVLSGPSLGVLSGANGATAKNGVATASGLILTTATTPSTQYTLQISSAAVPPIASTSTTPIAVTALAAQKFVVSTEPPSSVVAGTPFGLGITAEDKYGNTATSFTGSVAVALAHNPNPGTAGLAGTLSAIASSGVAQFSGLALDTVGTPYTISATNGSLTAALSTPITVTPATATALKVSIQPPTTMTSGSEFGLAIAALDQFGNLATEFTGPITIALDNNPGNATLNVSSDGSLTVVPTNGVSNFHAFITTETAASGYTLQATATTATGTISVITGPITVTPAPRRTLS